MKRTLILSLSTAFVAAPIHPAAASAFVTSSAQDPSSMSEEEKSELAKTYYIEAQSAFKAGDYLTAMTKYEEAYFLVPGKHGFAFKVGSAAWKLGDCVKADEYFRHYVTYETRDSKADKIEEAKKILGEIALSGCATTTQTTSVWPQDTLFDAPPPPRESAVDEWGQYHFTETTVYTGIKADRVGDLVVIRVSHSVNADSTATTSSNRTSTAEAAIETFLGIETVIPEIAPGFTPTASIGGSDTNQYSGDAGTNRSGRLQTTVTAKVLSVQPNNYLVVGARQQVKINNEVEIMWLFGLVDPRMIDPDNTISSRNIADLRMEYSGMGVVAEKQRPGWLTRALDVIRPF